MKKIALIGMPNSGKSTFFNSISGASARIANWSGVTVDIESVRTLIFGEMVELIDLPGIYSLQSGSDDEVVVHKFLKNNQIDEIFFILNSTQIDRQILLASELLSMGYTLRILCNMNDEAKKSGIQIQYDKLQKRLQTPIHPISAKFKEGYEFLSKRQEVKKINGNSKKFVESEIKNYISFPKTLDSSVTEKLDRFFLHPYFGLPIFFITLFFLFQIIYGVAEPIQDFLGGVFDYFGGLLQSNLALWLPNLLSSFIYDGMYLGITTVLTFVPVIIIFFLIMSFIENSGYLSRAAFLVDRMMEKMGLDGRSFVLILFGFGCNVPALMGTKIMRSKSIRYLSMLIIPFSLCSARLQVFLFFTAIFFEPKIGGLVLFSMYMISFLLIVFTAIIFKKDQSEEESVLIEMPAYQLPTLRQNILTATHEVKHFLARASKFILGGVIIVWFLTNTYLSSDLSVADFIGNTLNPIFDPIGINDKLIIALIFGFIAKEIVIGALAVIFSGNDNTLPELLFNYITWQQAISFMIFTLIYTPCLSTIAVIKNQSKSNKLVLTSLVWSLVLAWLISFAAYQSLLFLY
ncbi:MAG: ferrous iron transport protein B [Methylophilaceae bacterium]|jgi:ferrous iron transport protein B|nr:ferrous iron transport protein B [Methylophilaceae bacterium]NCV37736.1 ferrous iron transport protein B [Betaproteobacteria bacterium]NCV53218.1 ferrous iron transport protein B [Betaproteobacteria bacterium]NCW62632.1 ferrous iron transport protein B [Betaproteobacteria bacterium]NCX67565.1 ferrous iron transport protein B [Betaproteobacteria bacterium]